MSILSYKPGIVVVPPQPQQPQQGIIVLPNVIPPVPPMPPGPPINPINSYLNDTTSVIYNKVSNKIVDNSANLLNGIYVSKNMNSIPVNFTTQNILNINRFVSGTTTNLAITDSSLSLTTNINIFFWVYVVYNGNLTRPMTIITKGSNEQFGEYTVQILPNRLLSFSYTNNGIMYNLRSVSSIQERTLTFVSIIKTSESVGIYFNNRPETVQRMLGVSTATNNPVLIGSGFNSVPLNGFIDNLMINNIANGSVLIPSYFSYVPTSMFYQFTNGLITYNGFNVNSNINGIQPINVESAKFICTQLENFTNGFSISNDNKYIYYISYINGVNNIGGTIFEKINTLNMSNNYFTKLLINYSISQNVSFEENTLVDGYIKSYTGEVFYFIDGIVYEYNVSRNIFTISNINETQAYTILSIINSIIGYRNSFNRYQFFSNVKNMKENIEGLNNIFVRKLCNYFIGDNSSVVSLTGSSKAGTFRFNSDIQYLNVDTNKIRNMEENTNEILINKDIVLNSRRHHDNNINDILINKGYDQSSQPIIETGNMIKAPEYTENNIYVYVGQNIFSLLNTATDIFVNNLPSLDITIPFYFVIEKEVDIIETLNPLNIPIYRQIVVNCHVDVSPRIYNFSIISNSHTKILINNKEYIVNSNTPQHIVFHCSKNIIDIEIQFYYNKLNQVCKYILI